RRTACLAGLGSRATASDVLASLADALDGRLRQWDGDLGISSCLADWTARSYPIGTAMSVNTGHGLVRGNYAGLGPDGTLLLDQGAGRVTLTFGDVTIDSRPPA
ncbi:MAG TPA: hypothetical protein PK264_21630, partial [Hyphomicrobiaceae bacterium]|nr:hypothetical protein [Hyphomicrobiaceae bacterium]